MGFFLKKIYNDKLNNSLVAAASLIMFLRILNPAKRLDKFIFSESNLQYGEMYVVKMILYDTQGTSYSCTGDWRIVLTSGTALPTKFQKVFEIHSDKNNS